MSKYKLGDHLVSKRAKGVYTHHGIYIGNNQVIHYSGFAEAGKAGPVEIVTLVGFESAQGSYVKKHNNPTYTTEQSIERAKSRLGENGYSLFGNNCEHFVNWCIDGNHQSEQVQNISSGGGAAGASGTTAVAGVGTVYTAGAVTGLSGSGVMSGLASVGSVVGGGAVAGLGAIAGSGGLASAVLLNNTVLADDENLSSNERNARSIGRKATYGGAAVGTASGIAAVSAAGATAGLSGAGIASGLAAIGGTVGGGMVAGTALTVAAPATAAVAVGYGLYKAVKWFSD